jgi:hypothetical protein
MSEKQNHSLPQDEAPTEIEFNAEQLASLTKARVSAAPTANSTITVAPARAESAITPAPPGPDRWKSLAAVAGVGAVMVLSAIIGYEGLRSAPEPPPLPPPVAQIDEPSSPPVVAPVSDQEPLRVRNPFDRSEVFEFPAGTTPEAAKAAIADTLLDRARERQAEYDAKHPRRRRSRPG